jgi:hypothetical protein
MKRNGKWSEAGYPHKGYTEVNVIDTGELSEECEFCGTGIRYVHVLSHPDYDTEFSVGVSCAEALTNDYVNPKNQERKLKNFNRVKRPTNRGESMALVQPDFSEIKEDVGPGVYRGIIKRSEAKEWPNGGTYINWEIETFGEADPKNNGRRIFHKTPTSGKGAFLLLKFYKAATGQALTGAFDTETLLGKSVEVEVVEGKNYQTGAPTGYNEVKTVRAVAMN